MRDEATCSDKKKEEQQYKPVTKRLVNNTTNVNKVSDFFHTSYAKFTDAVRLPQFPVEQTVIEVSSTSVEVTA